MSSAFSKRGDKAFPLGADTVEQALKARFASKRLEQRVAVGQHRVIDRAARPSARVFGNPLIPAIRDIYPCP